MFVSSRRWPGRALPAQVAHSVQQLLWALAMFLLIMCVKRRERNREPVAVL